MRISRPLGLTLLTGALIVLLPALAVLQYRWVGQVSVAEHERMQRNLRNAALQFRDSFDLEIARAFLTLQVDPATARDGSSQPYSDRYDTWLDTAEHPRIVSEIFVVDAERASLRVRRWNADTHTFEAAGWPVTLERVRLDLERELENFTAGRPFDRRRPLSESDALLAAPMREMMIGTLRGARRPPVVLPSVFGFTLIQLDVPYIQHEILPALARRHFTHTDGDSYRVAVTAGDDPARVIYKSDEDAPVDPARADATQSFFELRGGQRFVFFRANGPGDAGRDGPNQQERRRFIETRIDERSGLSRGETRSRDDFGRWRLLVQHQSGSLETAISKVRRRNLAISFGVLLLLTLSVGLLALTSRHAHRLARQQMEFVAGVSHELRTPVAVIQSAAENLSHGVVGSSDRVKRYGEMIESEARRLGEMVEQVLQYAGIESGVGAGVRFPVAPREIIESAIEGSLTTAGSNDVIVHRAIASNLPPVLGDSAALRSAVQNLIANAIKYGGPDRWVGIKAEQPAGRRAEVHITVSDHGAGISSAELPRIFEPFYRGTEASARQVHGNGLGLSLVQRIVAAHGGRVTVTTSTNAGSSFTIALPAATAGSTPALSSEARAAAQS